MWLRPLIKGSTFKRNFRNKCKNQTYLCYEVEVWEGNAWAPVEELQGFLRNQGADTHRERRHAELCFLDRVPCWNLDGLKKYRLTCYISWSPCPDCALELVQFLGLKSNVSLRMCTAGIRTTFPGHEDGLRNLRDAGAQLTIMTRDEYEHCWDTFVDNQGQPFRARDELEVHIGAQCQRLENILWNPGN
ncbi:DNA dC-_dU-editing enzyme APOBEC-3G-like [Myotis lucifugus]|uniref:DNA dC->dU-editing enzyme APOBEC-3G-like n=1 Tax=Myotis lucifugus TaxID=59463 RepID=UPI000CCC89DB|nr:DNA dC->dU-editing enzyme APOBEC-3G-like [Myotis lucifugus]